MGQYYRVIIEQDNNKLALYDTKLGDESQGSKLMEHSWFRNEFVNAIAYEIFLEPKRVAWVGDYADSVVSDFPNIPVKALYEAAWGKEKEKFTDLYIKDEKFTINSKFLVNHDTKEYLDLNTYFINNVQSDGWCTHPLPLLTAIGNGLGGGDFYTHAQDEEQIANVGKWAWNKLELTDEAPEGYTEVLFKFIEE